LVVLQPAPLGKQQTTANNTFTITHRPGMVVTAPDGDGDPASLSSVNAVMLANNREFCDRRGMRINYKPVQRNVVRMAVHKMI
jgi:hypothetical protein